MLDDHGGRAGLSTTFFGWDVGHIALYLLRAVLGVGTTVRTCADIQFVRDRQTDSS